MADPFANMDPAFASALQQFMAASNGLVRPGSGYRSYEEQAQLYDDYRRGKPGQARAAPPGRSKHNHGFAMDLQYGPGGEEWAHANAGRFGLFFPMGDEPWHIEPAGELSGVQGADPGTYNLPAENPENVLAERLNAILNIVGQNPVTGSPGASIDPDETKLPMEEAGIMPESGVLAEAAPFTNATTKMQPAAVSSELTEGWKKQGFQGPTPTKFKGGGVEGGSKGELQKFAQSQLGQFGMNPGDIGALVELWNKESGWNPNAQNPTSTAYGIAQFLNGTWGGTGFQKTNDPYTQIRAGLQYIKGRYGSPSAALSFHHRNNWY
jgi:hypothetical protein